MRNGSKLTCPRKRNTSIWWKGSLATLLYFTYMEEGFSMPPPQHSSFVWLLSLTSPVAEILRAFDRLFAGWLNWLTVDASLFATASPLSIPFRQLCSTFSLHTFLSSIRRQILFMNQYPLPTSSLLVIAPVPISASRSFNWFSSYIDRARRPARSDSLAKMWLFLFLPVWLLSVLGRMPHMPFLPLIQTKSTIISQAQCQSIALFRVIFGPRILHVAPSTAIYRRSAIHWWAPR